MESVDKTIPIKMHIYAYHLNRLLVSVVKNKSANGAAIKENQTKPKQNSVLTVIGNEN